MSDADSKLTPAERRIASYSHGALAHARVDGRIDRLVEATMAAAIPATLPDTPPPTSQAPRSSFRALRAASVGTAAIAVVAFGWVTTREVPPGPPRSTAPTSTTTAAPAAPPNEVASKEPAPAPSGVAVTSLPDAVAARPAPTEASSRAVAAELPRADGVAVPVQDSARPAPQAADTERPAADAAPETREDPALLFEQANTARRRGDYGSAEKLYHRLVDTHPDTREASTSRIILGRMLLARGDAADALASFDAYLAGAPHGSLREQALIGRAQSLQALGRRDEERAAWRALLEAFPGTASRATALERAGDVR